MRKIAKFLLILGLTFGLVFANGGSLRNEAGEHVLLLTAPDSTPKWAQCDASGNLIAVVDSVVVSSIVDTVLVHEVDTIYVITADTVLVAQTDTVLVESPTKTPGFDAESIFITQVAYAFGGTPVRSFWVQNQGPDTLYVALAPSPADSIVIFPQNSMGLEGVLVDSLWFSSTDTLVADIMYLE